MSSEQEGEFGISCAELLGCQTSVREREAFSRSMGSLCESEMRLAIGMPTIATMGHR
jgi:hypothetical protein